jgi:hypothetical protein
VDAETAHALSESGPHWAVTALFREHHLELVRLAVLITGDLATDESEMMTALRSLPRRQREVLALRYYADLDVAEIAATLRIGASTVRSTISRGLASLARALEGEQR